MLYKIGDVAKMLGISADIMRYYEKKDIVRPHKDDTNDYRYYEAWDINFLIECLCYKEYGFGMNQISKMVSKSSFDEVLGVLDKKQMEIEAELEARQFLLAHLSEKIRYLKKIKPRLHQFDVQSCPDTIRYLNRQNLSYDNSPTIQKLDRQWRKLFPFVSRCFEVDQDTLLHGGEDFFWGYTMPMSYAEKFGVEIKSPVERFQEQKCLHYVFTQSGKYGITPKSLEDMANYAKEHGMAICGNVRGTLLCSAKENGVMTGYFEAWLPIE